MDLRALVELNEAKSCLGGYRLVTARTVDTALDILELLARRKDGARFSDLVADLRLPKSTANTVLAILKARKYVHRDDVTNHYLLGDKLRELVDATEHPELSLTVMQSARELSHRYGISPDIWVLKDRLITQYSAIGENRQVVVPVSSVPLGYLFGAGPSSANREAELVARRFADATGTVIQADPAGPGVRLAAKAVLDPDTPAVLEISIPEGRRQDVDWIHGLLQQREARLASDRPKIGWIMSDVALDSYRSIVGWAEYWAEQAGVDILWADSEENEVKEQLAARLLMDQQVDVLVVHPVNAYYSSAIFYEAVRRQIPTICFQRPAQATFDVFVGGSAYDWGRLQVQYLEQRDISGRVVLIEGDPNNGNSMAISRGVNDGIASLQERPLTLVYRQVVPKWSPNEAVRVVEGLRQTGTDYDILLMANDDMAHGVLRLFDQSVPQVLAGDGDRYAMDNIAAGRQAATVFQDYRKLARLVLEAQEYLRRGERPAGAKRRQLIPQNAATLAWTLDVPYGIVDQSNLDIVRDYWTSYQTQIVDGFLARRDEDGRRAAITAERA